MPTSHQDPCSNAHTENLVRPLLKDYHIEIDLSDRGRLGVGGFAVVYRGVRKEVGGNAEFAARIPIHPHNHPYESQERQIYRQVLKSECDAIDEIKRWKSVQLESRLNPQLTRKNLLQLECAVTLAQTANGEFELLETPPPLDHSPGSMKLPQYLVTCWEVGTPLWNLQEGQQRFRREVALQIISDIADGLDFIHYIGWRHGDIKAENVLHVGGRYKIGDLLSLKYAGQEGVSEVRVASLGVIPSDARERMVSADVYSLGLMFLELLAGRKFRREMKAEQCSSILEGALREKILNQREHDTLKELFTKYLQEKDVPDWATSATDLLKRLRTLVASPVRKPVIQTVSPYWLAAEKSLVLVGRAPSELNVWIVSGEKPSKRHLGKIRPGASQHRLPAEFSDDCKAFTLVVGTKLSENRMRTQFVRAPGLEPTWNEGNRQLSWTLGSWQHVHVRLGADHLPHAVEHTSLHGESSADIGSLAPVSEGDMTCWLTPVDAKGRRGVTDVLQISRVKERIPISFIWRKPSTGMPASLSVRIDRSHCQTTPSLHLQYEPFLEPAENYISCPLHLAPSQGQESASVGNDLRKVYLKTESEGILIVDIPKPLTQDKITIHIDGEQYRLFQQEQYFRKDENPVDKEIDNDPAAASYIFWQELR